MKRGALPVLNELLVAATGVAAVCLGCARPVTVIVPAPKATPECSQSPSPVVAPASVSIQGGQIEVSASEVQGLATRVGLTLDQLKLQGIQARTYARGDFEKVARALEQVTADDDFLRFFAGSFRAPSKDPGARNLATLRFAREQFSALLTTAIPDTDSLRLLVDSLKQGDVERGLFVLTRVEGVVRQRASTRSACVAWMRERLASSVEDSIEFELDFASASATPLIVSREAVLEVAGATMQATLNARQCNDALTACRISFNVRQEDLGQSAGAITRCASQRDACEIQIWLALGGNPVHRRSSATFVQFRVSNVLTMSALELSGAQAE